MQERQGRHTFFMTSKRLGFSTWLESDEALAAAIWGDEEVSRFIGGPFTPEQVRDRLAYEITNMARHGVQYWPIFRLDSGGHVGCCGLRPRDPASGIFELGFQLRRNSWGQGYASEAAEAVIDWAATKGVTALIAGHHPENEASRRALERLGFAYTHDELYAPTGLMEPCYFLRLAR